jgi:DNA-binding beta-propeller fold protein YncE
MKNIARIAMIVAFAFGGVSATICNSEAQPAFGGMFSLVGDYPLGPASSRMDYQSLDPIAGRLYVSLFGAGKLLIFDVRRNKVFAQLNGFPKATGVLAVPGLHRVYASVPGAGLGPSLTVGLGMFGLSSGHGAVAIVDTDSAREIARLPGGVFPDGIAYDIRDNRIFVSDELGSAITVIEASTGSLIARIAAGGEVGNVQYDATSARLYAPIQSRNELGVFDPVGNKRLGAYRLPGCKHPHGLAIAPDTAIGFVACDENDVLLTVDLRTGNILGHLPLGHDPDVLAMDPISRRLYVAAESGMLSTFDTTNPASPTSLGDVFVGTNAHSVSVDPTSHQLYFPLADAGGISVLRILKPNP